METEAAMTWAAEFSAECFASEEAAEGMKAFIEKRDAAWVEDRRGASRPSNP